MVLIDECFSLVEVVCWFVVEWVEGCKCCCDVVILDVVVVVVIIECWLFLFDDVIFVF